MRFRVLLSILGISSMLFVLTFNIFEDIRDIREIEAKKRGKTRKQTGIKGR